MRGKKKKEKIEDREENEREKGSNREKKGDERERGGLYPLLLFQNQSPNPLCNIFLLFTALIPWKRNTSLGPLVY